MELRPRRTLVVLLSLCGCGGEPTTNTPGPGGAWSVADLVPRKRLVPEQLFPQTATDPLYRYDPECVLLLEPGAESVWAWPEHDDGTVHVQVNDLGFLGCGPTPEAGDAPRVLVATDSHMMVVNCDENFPSVLERRLRAEGLACEFLASGVGYTSPELHLLRLRHFLRLEPEVFVLTVFTGNDFLDQLVLDFELSSSPKPIDAAYVERLEHCEKVNHGALYQGLNQSHFFAHWPGTEALALERVVGVVEETAALCEREGIALVVVLLPTKFDVDEDDPEGVAAALAALELPREALDVSRRVALGLARALAERGIVCVDPLEAMRASDEPCFWKKDYHLSTVGHERVVEALHDPLAALLGDRSGSGR